jgi:hypothetical protein
MRVAQDRLRYQRGPGRVDGQKTEGHSMTTDTSATRTGTGTASTPVPGPTRGDPRRFNVKGWLLWTAAFVSFPIAGIAAGLAVGRINDAMAALVGG